MTTFSLTRDSVAAGDDADAPHRRMVRVSIEIASPSQVQAVLPQLTEKYLPGVAGRASWIVYSNLPLGVLSNVWAAPKPVWHPDDDLRRLDVRQASIHLHFVYLAGLEPQVALEVIERTRSAFRS
jgi:hypothetical protein